MIRSRFLLPLLAAASLGSIAHAETFSIAVIPDPQHYSDETTPQPRGAETFDREMQYLVDHRADRHLVFTSFVGDIVQHGDGRFQDAPGGTIHSGTSEWDVAEHAISILSRAGMVFGMSPGNHDYDNAFWWTGAGSPGPARPLAGGVTWDRYFGPQSAHFAGKAWYGGSFDHGLNSWQTFEGGGRRFLHISFEMEPPQTVLDWAQHVINTHPGLPVIVSTHEWLRPEGVGVPAGTPVDRAPRSNDHEVYFPGSDHDAPDGVWDHFVRKNPAIFMVLCGHNYTKAVNGVSNGENLRIDTDDAGYPVYQVLQDYQGNTVGPDGGADSANGGAGWLRFITFDTTRHKIHFSTYSSLLDRPAGLNGEASFGIPASYSDFDLDFPPQLLKR